MALLVVGDGCLRQAITDQLSKDGVGWAKAAADSEDLPADLSDKKLSPAVLRRELEQLERRLQETDSRIAARLRWLARPGANQIHAAPDAPLMVA